MKGLFEASEQLSPRLAWFKNHDVKTHQFADFATGDIEKLNHISFGRWVAYVGRMPRSGDEGIWACGETEDEAIVRLACGMKWRLWNEEAGLTAPLNATARAGATQEKTTKI